MSEIEFDCPHCDQTLEGPDEMAGETIVCPACNRSFTIPELDEEEVEEGAVCPNCDADMPADAILCVACGYHKGLGKCIRTETDAHQ
jgi:ribosomal protein L40E